MNFLRKLRVWVLVRWNQWVTDIKIEREGHVMPDQRRYRGPWSSRWRED